MISVILAVLAFIGFGLMDEFAHHFDDIKIKWIKGNPIFWDKRMSWTNKWATKRMNVSHNDHIQHMIDNPVVGKEKFWGSSRWFVFLTDGWHLMQFISYQLLSLSISVAIIDNWIIGSIILHLVLSTTKSITMKLV